MLRNYFRYCSGPFSVPRFSNTKQTRKYILEQAQTLIVCQICQDSKQVKWKCIDCDRLICDNCKKTHEHIPASENHEILSLKTPLPRRSVRTGSKLCQAHKKNLSLHCSTCDVLVCTDCILHNHNTHKFGDINTIKNRQQQELKQFQEEIGKEKEILKNSLETFKTMKIQANQTLFPVIDAIKKRGEDMVKWIKDWEHSLTADINESITKYKGNLDTKIKETIHFIEITKDVEGQIADPNFAFEKLKKIKDKMRFPKLPEPRIPKIEFSEGNIVKDDKKILLGDLIHKQEDFRKDIQKDTTVSNKHFVKARWSYHADNDDELSFQTGDIIEVLRGDVEDFGWSEGCFEGRTGVYPTNFATEIEKSSIEQAKVEWEYIPEVDDELKLVVGTIIDILSKDCEDGWWFGHYQGKVGKFPSNFVTVLRKQ